METRSMLVITKNNVILRDEALDLLLYYTRYFIRDCQTKLDAHMHDFDHYRQIASEGEIREDTTILNLQSEISRAEALVQDGERLKGELITIYRWNFVKLAEVLRKTRLQLGQEQIENMYSLKVVLTNLMDMLRGENRMFSDEKFISYINEGR